MIGFKNLGVRPLYFTSSWLCIAAAFAFPGDAIADSADQAQADAEGNGIVVTAQRRSELLQNVPIAITAISSDQLKSGGVTDTSMLASLTPGLVIHQTGQAFQPHIRGVGTAAFGPGVENPVALYVDDVYIASQVQGIIDTVDVAQVAILKGPQGTLFGRNATGGVIQLTTREPEQEFGGQIRTELDNYLTSRTNLYLTGGLGQDVKANLSLGYATQGDGWGKNLTTGEDVGKIDNYYTARGKIEARLGDRTTLKLAADYADKADVFGGNRSLVPGSQMFLDLPVPRTSNPYDSPAPFPGRIKSHGGGASVSLDHDFGFATVHSITAYRGYNFRIKLDTSFNPVPLIDIGYTQTGEQFSQELQLTSPEGKRLNWIVGAYYLHDRERVIDVDVTLHGPFARLVPFVQNTFVNRNNGVQTINSVAGFAQVSVALGDTTNVTFGGRYTHETRRRTAYAQDSYDGGPFIPEDPITGFLPVATLADATVRDSQTANRATFRASLDHRLSPDVMLYASYNRGFKSGGFNLFRVDAPSYRPESIDAFEIGLKSELLDRRVTLNLAGFYNKYRDIQVQKFIGPSAVIVNGPRARFYGIDMDARIELGGGLSVSGGLEWLNAKFTKYDDADYFFTIPHFGTGHVSGPASGNRVPYAPAFTGNINVTYTYELANGRIEATVGDSYTSTTYTEPSNLLTLSPNHMVTANLTFVGPDDRFTASIWGRNLANNAVPTFKFAVTPVGFGQDFASPPLTAGVTLTYRFGAQ